MREIPNIDIDVFSDHALYDPYQHHETFREAGPVFRIDRYGVYGMARHAEVAAALKDWPTFCSARGVGLTDFARETPWRPPSLLLEADPPLHDRTRRIMNSVVSMQALKNLRAGWQETTDTLIDELIARRFIDGVTDLAEVFPLRVFPDTLGLPNDGRHHLLQYAAATFNAFGPRNEIFERSEREAREAIGWVAEACKRTNLHPGGWGQQIYAAADRGECTEDEAARLVRSLITAGLDTTINGIGNALNAFVEFPDQWAALLDDPALLKKAFDEALRWDSTVQIFFRTTTRGVEIEDFIIPEGSKVLLFLAAANRDPRRWENPDKLDMRRQSSGHVGFGFGIHQCLGQMVARMELELVLTALAKRVKAISRNGMPQRRLNNTLHALSSLPIELHAA